MVDTWKNNRKGRSDMGSGCDDPFCPPLDAPGRNPDESPIREPDKPPEGPFPTRRPPVEEPPAAPHKPPVKEPPPGDPNRKPPRPPQKRTMFIASKAARDLPVAPGG